MTRKVTIAAFLAAIFIGCGGGGSATSRHESGVIDQPNSTNTNLSSSRLPPVPAIPSDNQ